MSVRGIHAGIALLCASACASAPAPAPPPAGGGGTAAPARAARSRPSVPVRSLMDVCWPRAAAPTERVKLTFYLESGRLQDVIFEPAGGASNATGRCLQQIVWEYPWEVEPGGIPELMVVSPPAFRPSGWNALAYISLLAEGAHGPERGLLAPAPLVRACMENGTGIRPHVRFRVLTQPVRVSAFFELSEVERPEQRRTEADLAITDSERCIKAVLASTVFAGTRNFELEFSDLSGAPPPAPAAEVSAYFPPRNAPGAEVAGTIEPLAVRDVLSEKLGRVTTCWEEALQRRSGLFGGRTFRLRVGAGGQVDYAHVVANRSDREDEAEDYLLDRCVGAAISSARFPPVRGGGAEVAYSFVFERR